MSTPLRVGLVGLGKTEPSVAPGTWGSIVHLPSILNSDGYELVAVANSSAESTKQSITFHGLSDTVKAYGSVEELATDPDVDLVVVSVQVAKHYALAKPALLQGKHLFVEWPFGTTVTQAEELTHIAKASNLRTIVGLQGRADPLTRKLKEIIASGHIGQVISSTVVGSFSAIPADIVAEGAEYYADMENGSNGFHNYFGHFLDSFTHVLGNFDELSSILKSHVTSVKVLNATGGIVNPALPKTTPDNVFVQGVLKSGAIVSLNFRLTESPVGGTGIRWIITGSQGEIEATLPETQGQFRVPQGTKLQIRLGKEGETTDVVVSEDMHPNFQNVAWPGTNTARLYQAFLLGEVDKYATFESALETKKLLNRISGAAGYPIQG